MRGYTARALFLLGLLMLSMVARSEDPGQLFVVHFETGPGWQQGLTAGQQTGFNEHAANLQRLRKDGKLVFGARYQQYGMVFLVAENLIAAKLILDSDPGVNRGLFIYEVAEMQVFYPWRDEKKLPLL
jgi:hypothetical protein